MAEITSNTPQQEPTQLERDRLDIKKGKTKRNLQWILVAIIAVVMVVMMIMRGGKEEAETKDKHAAEDAQKVEDSKTADSLNVEKLTHEQMNSPEPNASGSGSNAVEELRKREHEIAQNNPVTNIAGAGGTTDANGKPFEVKSEMDRRREAIAGTRVFEQSKGSAVNGIVAANGMDAKLNAAIDASTRQLDILASQKPIVETSGANGKPEAVLPMLPKTNAQQDEQWLKDQTESKQPHDLAFITKSIGNHVLYEGTSVPSIVTEVIDSDMPGKFSAKTRVDVYDRSGALVLPAGTTVLGLASTNIHPGQEAILSAFYRFIMPNGDSIWLNGMQGGDALGKNGIPGEVNNHFWKMYTASFAIAAIQGFMSNSNNTAVTTNQPSGSVSVVGTAAGQTLSDVSRQILQRNSQMQPTVSLKPGQTFNIKIVKDILVEPYKG